MCVNVSVCVSRCKCVSECVIVSVCEWDILYYTDLHGLHDTVDFKRLFVSYKSQDHDHGDKVFLFKRTIYKNTQVQVFSEIFRTKNKKKLNSEDWGLFCLVLLTFLVRT